MNVEQARFNMIEQQIRPWDVLDPAVLALLGRLRREDFVPAAHRALAFVDTQVPLTDRADGCKSCACSPATACSKSAPARASWPRCWPAWPGR
jgi:protein-L-isoaspartate O-methyltransferase